MSKTTTEETRYAVARGEKIVSDEHGHTAVESAQGELGYLNKQMENVGLDPDLRLVEFDVKTTVERSRVRAYREPAPEDTEAPTADAPAQGDASTDEASTGA
jgi:hypothetical protein